MEIIGETPNHVDMSWAEPVAMLFYIGEEVRNPEVLEWYRHTGEDPDVDYAEQLRDLAGAEGIVACPLADHLDRR